jgi:hypothetical protein
MNSERPTELHLLKADLAFPESPRWHDGRLWVSDWGAQQVLAVDLEGRSEVVARVESLMCIHHLPDGRLLVVSSTESTPRSKPAIRAAARAGNTADQRSEQPSRPARHRRGPPTRPGIAPDPSSAWPSRAVGADVSG